jgi:hypothetical protein
MGRDEELAGLWGGRIGLRDEKMAGKVGPGFFGLPEVDDSF